MKRDEERGDTAHEETFFRLLRLAIGTGSTDDIKMDEDGWKAVYAMACKQTLAGVVFDGVEKLGGELRPPLSVLMPWIALVQKIEAANRRMNRTAAKVCNRFEREGMGCVVLKGQGNARLYPNPLRRMSGDIDLWVEGGREKLVRYVRKYCPDVEIVYHHVDFPVLKDVEIEVHFTPSWMNNPRVNRRLQDSFCRWLPEQLRHRVALPEDCGEIAVPTAEMNRIYLLLHIYRHLFDEGIGLRQLLDYYFVLSRPATEEEKREAVCMLERLRMKRFASAVMFVLQKVFGMCDECLLLPPSERYGRSLLDEIMLAGNFGKYDERIVLDRNETPWRKFCRKVGRNFRFVKDYPDEVVWSPLFKIWHYLWRYRHGYFGRSAKVPRS